MSMINNSANPLESSKKFTERERELQQSRKADTMSGRFQPAIGRNDVPQTFPQTNLDQENTDTVDNVNWIEQQNVGIQQEKDRFNQAALQVQKLETARKQNAANASGRRETSNAYQSDGTLSDTRQRILNTTASYAGTPYQLGGRTVKGIDCSGLVMSVYNQLGFNVQSHSVSGQARTIPGAKTSVSNLQPGDLVVWNDNSHIAVYAGNGMIWDASSGKGTTMRPLWSGKTYGIAVKLPGE
jgi:cell wall-associated NlpC family hydrolase